MIDSLYHGDRCAILIAGFSFYRQGTKSAKKIFGVGSLRDFFYHGGEHDGLLRDFNCRFSFDHKDTKSAKKILRSYRCAISFTTAASTTDRCAILIAGFSFDHQGTKSAKKIFWVGSLCDFNCRFFF